MIRNMSSSCLEDTVTHFLNESPVLKSTAPTTPSRRSSKNSNVPRRPSRNTNACSSTGHSKPNSRQNSPRRIASEQSFQFVLSSESLESQVYSHREALESAALWYNNSNSPTPSRSPSRQQSMGNFVIEDGEVGYQYEGGRKISMNTSPLAVAVIASLHTRRNSIDTEIDGYLKSPSTTKPRSRSNSIGDESVSSSVVACIGPSKDNRGEEMTPRKYKRSSKCPLSPPPSPPITSRSQSKDGTALFQIKEALENLDSVCDKTIQQKKEVPIQRPPTEKSFHGQPCLATVSNHCIIQ